MVTVYTSFCTPQHGAKAPVRMINCDASGGSNAPGSGSGTDPLLPGYVLQWSDSFESLSLRTGNLYSGTTTGYNDPAAKGVWSPCGHHYMTGAQGFSDFGHGVFVNPNFNWQALDPTFPPLGMIDITAGGVVLKGTDQYPIVRSQWAPIGNQQPYLSSLICTAQSMKIGLPYARRYRFTLNTANWSDFPACWGLGNLYNGDTTKFHYELDDFEWFGGDNTVRTTSQGTHISDGVMMNFGGGTIDTGTVLAGGAQMETLVIHTADFIYMYTNGILSWTIPVPVGAPADDLHHAILNMAVGMSWENYPGVFQGSISGTTLTISNISPSTQLVVGQTLTDTVSSLITAGTIITALGTGTGGYGTYTVNNSQTYANNYILATPAFAVQPSMTVRSVEIWAPPSNTTGIFPATPPVPLLTWGGGFPGGAIPVATSNGTVVAALSGAAGGYSVLGTTKLAVSGTNLVTVGALSASTITFYIRGTDVSGNPGIAPKLTAIIS